MSSESIESRDYPSWIRDTPNFTSKTSHKPGCNHHGSLSQQLSTKALLSRQGSREQEDHDDLYDTTDYHQHHLHLGPGIRRKRTKLWSCLAGCRYKVDQQLARRRVDQGIKLYTQQKYDAAVSKWKSALKHLYNLEERFTALSYLYQAHLDRGKYRCMVEVGLQQLSLADEAESPRWRTEACLNLAQGYEGLGRLHKALAYGGRALDEMQIDCDLDSPTGCTRDEMESDCDVDGFGFGFGFGMGPGDHAHSMAGSPEGGVEGEARKRITGLVHLRLGMVQLHLSNFHRAVECFNQALKVAWALEDLSLKLQIYVALAQFFRALKDAENSLFFAAKAYELSRSFPVCDLNSKCQRSALLQLASALRKQGRLVEAREFCHNCMKKALASGDESLYSRSLIVLGDIHRQKSETSLAYRHYEQAARVAAGAEDRLAQLGAMEGLACCLDAFRKQGRLCECRPLRFNQQLLEFATNIGCKLILRATHVRLGVIYQSLGDPERQRSEEKLAARLEEEMELECGACKKPFGLEPDHLETLPCSHILHARCARDWMKPRERRRRKRVCPACRFTTASRVTISCYDELRAAADHRPDTNVRELSL